MTLDKAKKLLQGEIGRRKNLIQRMEDEKQPEVNINSAKIEVGILENILKELENP